jgi:hypothetical protein
MKHQKGGESREDSGATVKQGTHTDPEQEVPVAPRYGIRAAYVSWGAIDGGRDLVGSKEEIDAVAARWTAELQVHVDQRVTYEVLLYDGVDPASRPEVEEFLARETEVQP